MKSIKFFKFPVPVAVDGHEDAGPLVLHAHQSRLQRHFLRRRVTDHLDLGQVLVELKSQQLLQRSGSFWAQTHANSLPDLLPMSFPISTQIIKMINH